MGQERQHATTAVAAVGGGGSVAKGVEKKKGRSSRYDTSATVCAVVWVWVWVYM